MSGMDVERFPIIGSGGQTIPWAVIAQHEKQAGRNHGQTLRRLAERGGLDWTEALWVLTGQPWGSTRNDPDARAKVLALCGEQRP